MTTDNPWGTLNGVRPSKLLNQLMNKMGREDGYKYFMENYLVSEPKAKLALDVAKHEERIISIADKGNFSLYISIPFCPSRCNYCSFVSHSITSDRAKKMLVPYLQKLNEEIEQTALISKDLNIKLLSVYIGGGTPSILSADQIDSLLKCIETNFDMSNILEFTFEAGRPDTITKEKLEVLKKHLVTRISINPQSFSDDVLVAIGRKHTALDTINAYRMAKDLNFENINCDLIAGLENDTLEKFKYSLSVIEELNPKSVTLHTLALKRSAENQFDKEKTKNDTLTIEMLKYANTFFRMHDYIPYYMYRQKNTLGMNENVGWAKPGFESYYNVFMMEECQSVFACGAGAVTKLKTPGINCIERIFNYKYPYEYIERFDIIKDRKQKIYDFYNNI